MKKGIEVYPEYDRTGTWRLIVQKKKGKLSVEEIREAAREWDWDYYLMVIDASHDPDDVQDAEVSEGDMAILYSADILKKEWR